MLIILIVYLQFCINVILHYVDDVCNLGIEQVWARRLGIIGYRVSNRKLEQIQLGRFPAQTTSSLAGTLAQLNVIRATGNMAEPG